MLGVRTMTQTARPLVLALAACAAALGMWGCSSTAPVAREPAVAQIVVPVHSAAESAERGAAKFHCDPAPVRGTTRIEFRVQSAASDGSLSVQTRAVYTVTLEAETDDRVARAEIVLESISTDAEDRAQSAWTVGLDAGWISLRRPFQISREGATWCLVSACEDITQQEFAGAIGDTAELVALPELTEQLTRADDSSALTLPPALMKRLGLGTVDPAQLSPTARRRGLEFPALFVVERRGAAAADAGEADEEESPVGNGPLARAELLVSQSCRLQALRVELARTAAGDGVGATHRFSWSFDPLP